MKADLSISTKDEPDSTSTIAAPAVVASLNTPDILVSPNPWQDANPLEADDVVPETKPPKPLPVLDPSIFDQPIFTAKDTPPSEPGSAAATQEVLSEFDPLVSEEERAARDAWGASEGHPPPPRTPSPPQPPVKDIYVSSPTSPGPNPIDSAPTTPAPVPITSPSSPFPSFASLARSFALPLARSRPQSIDASARAVPSPATLSSFAAQQDGSDGGRRVDTGKAVASGPPTPNQPRSATGSPAPKASDGGFDFQKFLDQMKSKSAEPVSKYLRSYVFLVLTQTPYPFFILRFLSNFAKRTFTVNDQVKIINDFLSVRLLSFLYKILSD